MAPFLVENAHHCLDLNRRDLELISSPPLSHGEVIAFFKSHPISTSYLDQYPPDKKTFLTEIAFKVKEFRRQNNQKDFNLLNYLHSDQKPIKLKHKEHSGVKAAYFYQGVVNTDQDRPISDFLVDSTALSRTYFNLGPVRPRRAERLFQKHCSSCHSLASNVGIILPLPESGNSLNWAWALKHHKVDSNGIPLAAKRMILGEMPMGREIPEEERKEMIDFLLAQ